MVYQCRQKTNIHVRVPFSNALFCDEFPTLLLPNTQVSRRDAYALYAYGNNPEMTLHPQCIYH
jgi:hypothetical protein